MDTILAFFIRRLECLRSSPGNRAIICTVVLVTGFTGTTVQVLASRSVRASLWHSLSLLYWHTCFTSTKVRILTAIARYAEEGNAESLALSLLALLLISH
jgi:hypothetical protein